MITNLILALAALALGLYALRELAPATWSGALEALRRPTPIPAGAAAAEIAPQAAAPTVTRPAERLLLLAAPAAVVVLALALRVIDLTGSPFGFFCDEASNALDAYWLAHTLRDQHGSFLPAFFYALSDWRGGFHIYWEVPFVALFGLNEFAVRLGSAVAGTLTVLLTYAFVSRAANRWVGLIAAFLLATSPWHLMQSRVGWEEVSLPFATALCLACLYAGLRHPRWLPLAFVFGALGMYTYQPGRVFFPLFCLAWLAIYAVPLIKRWRYSLIGVAGAGLVLVPTLLSMLDGTFFARLNQVNGGPPLTLGQRLATFWANYQAHFSPHFLFQAMTPEEWITRHFIRGYGMLYPIEAPFLVIGVAAILVRLLRPGLLPGGAGGRRFDLLCLAWFLIYPIAASLIQTPVSHRSLPGVIVFQVAVAWGVYLTCRTVAALAGRLALRSAYRTALTGAVAGLLLLAGLGVTAGFMHDYLTQYPLYSSGWDGWQWGPEPAVAYFIQHRAAYDRQYLDVDFNATDELIRFYATPSMPVCATCMFDDPAQVCNCGTTDIMNAALWQATYAPRQRQLWVVTPDQLAQTALNTVPHRVVHSLTYPNGQTAFVFVATGPQVAAAHSARGAPRA